MNAPPKRDRNEIPLDMPVSPRLSHNIIDIHGAAGQTWLARLPGLLTDCANRWSLVIERPYDDLSYNYVTRVRRADGTLGVLKAGVPDRERESEIHALTAFDGNGMVRLLESDVKTGIGLLERLEPGRPLSALVERGRDREATLIAAGLMRSLWTAAPANGCYFTVESWAGGLQKMRRRYDGGTGPLPADLVEMAEGAYAELIPESPAMLLHGDLHHGNILSAQRAPWLAIDPKGLVGPPGYDAGNFLRSNLESLPDPRRALNDRLDVLSAECGIDRHLLRRWSLAQGVLSAWWSIEDHGDGWQDTIAMVRILAEMPD